MERLDPRVINLWRVQGLVRLFTFWLPVLGVLSVLVTGRFGFAAAAAFVGAGLSLVAALTLLWPALSWRSFGYAVREHDLLVQRGVLLRHTVSVPLGRIQHVDLRQGPIERLWGLTNLLVYTAAGMNADGSIPGLDEETASWLRDELGRRGGDDGV